jgi:hypothetical protein
VLDLARHLDGILPDDGLVGQVEVGLVDADLLYQGRGHPQDGHDTPRILAVEGVARRDDDRLGTEGQRAGHGHGRSDAERSGRIGCGGDHATLARPAADKHGLAGEGRVFEHLDGGIEGVKIEMDDGSRSIGHSSAIMPRLPGAGKQSMWARFWGWGSVHGDGAAIWCEKDDRRNQRVATQPATFIPAGSRSSGSCQSEQNLV